MYLILRSQQIMNTYILINFQEPPHETPPVKEPPPHPEPPPNQDPLPNP